MKKAIIFVILIVLAFLIGFLANKVVFTGKAVEDGGVKNYSWTKAVCNSENECLDVLITCENGKAVKIEPVSDVIKHSKEWKDPRGELSNRVC